MLWLLETVTFHPEHPDRQQKLWFIPLSEKTSIPGFFLWEYPTGFQHCVDIRLSQSLAPCQAGYIREEEDETIFRLQEKHLQFFHGNSIFRESLHGFISAGFYTGLKWCVWMDKLAHLEPPLCLQKGRKYWGPSWELIKPSLRKKKCPLKVFKIALYHRLKWSLAC